MLSQDVTTSTIRLIAQDACGSTSHFDLAPDQGVFVGSSDNCGLKLRGETVAAIHCRIENQNGSLTVQDWMTAPGTRVNGQDIEGQTEIQVGDRIQIDDGEILVQPVVDASQKTVTASSSPQQEVATSEVATQEDDANVDIMATVTEPNEAFSDRPIREPETVEFEREPFADVFDFDSEEEMFDRETVELLQAEIAELQSVIARHDAERLAGMHEGFDPSQDDVDEPTEASSERLQQLIDEANRSDERVALLEEMLHAAEDSNRSEVEERLQLEAWVGDIESRIGQREDEHRAEVESLHQQINTANEQQQKLLQKLQSAAGSNSASQEIDATLQSLQNENHELRQRLAETEKQCAALQRQVEESSSISESELRVERAKIAQEQAKISRMRFELSQKLSEFEAVPKTVSEESDETSTRIRALREHLREIHQQEKQEEKEASLTSRLAKLWKRVEY